jgi:transposase-like protein
MKEKNQAVPDEVLSKEFISQFKTEADVSKFLKQLHAQVLEKMLEGEMDDHLGYEKNSMETTPATLGMAVIRKRFIQDMENLSSPFRVTATVSLNR